MRAHQGIKAGLADFGDQRRAVCHQVARKVVIAGGALAMAVVFIEAQLRVSAGRAVMPSVVLPVMVATAADARQMPIPVPDEFIECLLGLLDEVTEWFYCLATFGLLRPLFFRLLALTPHFRALRIFPSLGGLLFGNVGGALVAADHLAVTDRVEPLTAALVCALTAGFLSHAHPQAFWRNVRGVGSRYLTSSRCTLTVQVL